MNEIKMNDDNSGDTYELCRNLFSTQIFKPSEESYSKNGFLNENEIKFQSDENGFLFSDGKTELEKNYLSDNEFSFGEAVEFIEQLENDSLKINLKINFEQVWSNIKLFFGFRNKNQNDEQKRLQIMFGYLADRLKQKNMSKKFDDLRIKAKKLDDALNQPIKITDRQNLIKISLEIKKCYFEFESLVKQTLNVAKKIIFQENYLSTERLNIIEKKYGSETGNYATMKNTFEMVKEIIACSDDEKMEKCSDIFNELLNLLEPDNIEKLESRKDLINDIKQIVSLEAINLRDNFKRYIVYQNKINQIKTSLSQAKNKNELIETRNQIKTLASELQPYWIEHYCLSKKYFNQESYTEIINDFEGIMNSLGAKNKGIIPSSFITKNLNNVDDQVVACDNLYKMLSDLESMTDNENLFYKIVDDEISLIEISLSKYDKDLISKAKEYENQLRKMSNRKNISNKLNELKLELSATQTQEQKNKKEYDEFNNKHDKNSQLRQEIENIYQAYNYTNIIIFNQETENVRSFKTDHNVCFWLYSHREIFLIGYLFRFIAWIMLTCSRNLKSTFDRYKISLNRLEVLDLKNNLCQPIDQVKFEDEFKDLCNKIFENKNENKNEINTSNQNFVVNESTDYVNLANRLLNEIKNKLREYNPSLILDENSIDNVVLRFCNQITTDSGKLNFEKSSLHSLGEKIRNLQNNISQGEKEYSEIRNPKNEINLVKPYESEKLLEIYEMNLKIKQLNTPYEIISALESQARILEANRSMFSILASELLDTPTEKIKGKSVDQLLRTKDIPQEQKDESPEPPTIKTLYFSKDKLTKIKEKQSKNAKSGSFNTVFEHKGKILKPGKMRMICGSNDTKTEKKEASRLNCFKKNSSVLVDTAVKGNVAYEVAKLFDLNCIVSTSIAISDDNHISVMEDAHKNGRVFWGEIENNNNEINYQQKNKRLSAKKPQNAYKLSCSELDSDDMDNSVIEKVHDKKVYPVFKNKIKLKNEKNEQERKKKKVQRLRKSIEKPENAYKLFSSISELNFLDVLLLQIDRHNGNYSYNAASVKGTDNDLIMATKSGLLIKDMNKYMGIYDSGENKYLRARPRKYKKNSIEQLAMLKIPVIPKELHDKIMNVSSENLRTVLDIFYIDDDCGKEKVDFAIKRFEEIKKLISNNVIKIVDKFDDNVMSEILTQYDLCRIEKFIATNDGKNIEARYLSKNVFENPILEISTNHKVQNLIPDKWTREGKKFYSDWLDGLIKSENPKSEEKNYYEKLKMAITEIDADEF